MKLTKNKIINIVKHNGDNFKKKYLSDNWKIDKENNQIERITEVAIDWLKDNLEKDFYTLSELNELELNDKIFNEDYFIIGTYKAKKFIGSNMFEVIEYINDYHYDLDIKTIESPEKLVNLFAYAVGCNLLSSPYDELKEFHGLDFEEEDDWYY